MSRRLGGGKDIRSKIKHSNVHLGSGVELERTTIRSNSPAAAIQQLQQQATAYQTSSTAPSSATHQSRPSQHDVGSFAPPDAFYGGQPSQQQQIGYPQQQQQFQQQPYQIPQEQAQRIPNVGAGPSYISHSSSGSVSGTTFDGRSNQITHQPQYGRPSMDAQHPQSLRSMSPAADPASHLSRPSYEPNQQMTRPPRARPPSVDTTVQAPNRPQRSLRRPGGRGAGDGTSPSQSNAPLPTMIPPVVEGYENGYGSAAGGVARPTLPSISIAPAPHIEPRNLNRAPDRPARSARLIAQVNHLDGRETPASMHDSDEDIDDSFGGTSPVDPPSARGLPGAHAGPATLGSLTRPEEPAALGSVLSALSAAGRKHQGRRIMRGMTAEEESRRRKVEKKLEAARQIEYRDIRHYDTGGVGRIGAVLFKTKAEWGFVSDDDFNAVALVLSLMDESSSGVDRGQFDLMKDLLENALQGTVNDHYESFATAITLHNSVLSSLTQVQNSVSSARRRLKDSREALGSKRADLVQLWHRQQGVKEAMRLLNTVEQLKNVPDRLETLLSDKHYLTAVNLLMRALKIIQKPEMFEIGALSDLRTYLQSQEGHMLEILVDEIQSHLYLKSPYCDRRWRGYRRGEQQLPDVIWGSSDSRAEVEGSEEAQGDDVGNDDEVERMRSAAGEERVPTKLAEYLQGLPDRSVVDYLTLADDGGGLDSAMLHSDARGRDGIFSLILAGADRERTVDSAGVDDNPESDSFLYIEMLLESLARMDKLGTGLDIVYQRLSVEIHGLVEATIREVEDRTELLRRSTTSVRPESILLASTSALARAVRESGRWSFGDTLTKTSGDASSRHLSNFLDPVAVSGSPGAEVMRDLFWTLFSKLDAVLQGHRALHEVAVQLSRRSGFKESSGQGQNGSSVKVRGRILGSEKLLDIWRPIQGEVRQLLHEYLMDDVQSPTARRNNIVSINEVLRQGQFNRDKSKKLFQLSDTAGSSANPTAGSTTLPRSTSTAAALAKREVGPVKRHEEALNAALRVSVPGLLNIADTGTAHTGGSYNASHQREENVLAGSRETPSSVAGNHRLLVKPDAFNISVLFQPALAFVERVRVILPNEASGETSKGFSGFLDEFVQDVFLPQLEDKVQALFQSAVDGSNAFLEDPSSRGISAKPVIKSAATVIVLIDSLYSMLCTTPFHRESYSRLIIQTIVRYFSKCHERFRELVSADHSTVLDDDGQSLAGPQTMMLSAKWAQEAQVAQTLGEMSEPGISAERKRELLDEENQLEIHLARLNEDETVDIEDLITSRKKLSALGTLSHSLQWFVFQIAKFEATTEALPVTQQANARMSLIADWTTGGPTAAGKEAEGMRLPLSSEMAARFDTLPRTYRHMSATILHTLRLELRARVIHHLDLAVSEGNYLVEESAAEPDPHVVDLNAELANLDDVLADSLTPEDHRFLFEGMSGLMDMLLISAVRKLRSLNRPGVSKMIRNILALQQNLKNIIISDAGGFSSLSLPSEQTASAAAAAASQVSFDSSRRFWELLSKSPSEMLAAVKQETAAAASGEGPKQKYNFEDVKSALNLMLGLENAPVANGAAASAVQTAPKMTPSTSSASTAATPLAVGPSLPTLRAGTVEMKEGVSRQKFNEYLIELHQVLDTE